MTATADAVGAAAPPARRRRRRIDWIGYAYIAPATVVFLLFLGIPALQTVQYSFYDWDGLSVATPAGIANYVRVFSDTELRDAFGHALVLIVFFAFLPVAIGLVLTALISRAYRMRVMSVFRTVLFLPQVIASVVTATIWISIYSQNGLLNGILRAIGLGAVARVWLGDYGTALPAIGVVGTWVNIGLCLVLFLSGIGNIRPELFEAARIDGASRWREFASITLPSLRGQIAVALTITVVSALKSFDLVYVTTRGGPGTSTTVPAFEAYNRAFNQSQVGQASAVAVVLAIVILLVVGLISRIQPRDVE